jgi:hypothetical protein
MLGSKILRFAGKSSSGWRNPLPGANKMPIQAPVEMPANSPDNIFPLLIFIVF